MNQERRNDVTKKESTTGVDRDVGTFRKDKGEQKDREEAQPTGTRCGVSGANRDAGEHVESNRAERVEMDSGGQRELTFVRVGR